MVAAVVPEVDVLSESSQHGIAKWTRYQRTLLLNI